jgi:sulfatase modifying factor 1
MRLTIAPVLMLTGCLLGVEYDKVESTGFCSGEPGELSRPPSCAAGTSQDLCGEGYNVDCCSSPPVSCGSFNRDFDGSADYPDDSHPATVSDFRMDEFEVTVGRFRVFVDLGLGTLDSPPPNGAGAHPRFINSGWVGSYNAFLVADQGELKDALNGNGNGECARPNWTDTVMNAESKPINCVTWFEAMAFCAWDEGQLPTEAEWNYAATGGDEQRRYPWSDELGELTHELAVFGCPSGVALCPTDTSAEQVGRFQTGRGRFRQVDLAGNVAEWVFDFVLDPDTYKVPCDDCLEFSGMGDRGVRGGGYDSTPLMGGVDDLRASFRAAADPSTRRDGIGFRCVRALN